MHKFIVKRNTIQETSDYLDNRIFVIDRLHIQGHVEPFQQIYHPKLYPDIDKTKSMICEQRNFWISGFKYMCRHMNEDRFNFFFYIQFDYFNQVKVEGIIPIANVSPLPKGQGEKRKFTSLYSEDESDEDEADKQNNKKTIT